MNNNKTIYSYTLFIFLILLLFVNGKYTQNLIVEDKVSHGPGLDLNTGHEKEINPNDDQIGVNRAKYPLISAETAKKLVDQLWKKYPIVDGLLEPHKYDVDFEIEIAIPTQTNIFSGKITATVPDNPYFSRTKNKYINYDYANRSNVRFVKTARELSCIYTNDYIPEFIHYQQKPWATSHINNSLNKNDLENEIKEWIDTVSVMMQPEYSKKSNEELYDLDRHYAGKQYYLEDVGLTNKGEVLVKSYVKYGGMIDASHTTDKTFIDMITISNDLISSLGVPVPLFLNHTNIDGRSVNFPSYLENAPAEYSRNKTLSEICLAAKTGGVWGVMPIKIYTDKYPSNADFYDLADQIFYIKNYKCMVPGGGFFKKQMKDFKGDTIDLINHIIVSSDANIYYFDKNDEDEQSFYIDEQSSKLLKWKDLANYLLTHDFDGDGHRDFSIEDIKKIFSSNAINSYVRALDGALPMGEKFCTFDNQKRYKLGRFLNTNKVDFSLADSTKTVISKSLLRGHFDGPDFQINHKKGCLRPDQQSIIGDFDGNGFDDFLCYENGLNRFMVKLNQGEGIFIEKLIKVSEPCGIDKLGRLKSADINGDLEDEVICHNQIGDIYGSFLNLNSRLETESKLIKKSFCNKAEDQFIIGRLNSDNKEDFYCHHKNGTYHSFISGAPRKPNLRNIRVKPKSWCKITSNLKIYLGDFDGDGLSDRLCHSRNNGRLWIDFKNDKFSGTDWSEYDLNFCMESHESISVADTGGDSKDDVLCYDHETGYLSTLRGSKKGLIRPKNFHID